MTKKAMQQALEALEDAADSYDYDPRTLNIDLINAAISSLREAMEAESLIGARPAPNEQDHALMLQAATPAGPMRRGEVRAINRDMGLGYVHTIGDESLAYVMTPKTLGFDRVKQGDVVDFYANSLSGVVLVVEGREAMEKDDAGLRAFDTGPWRADDGCAHIASDDFEVDALLIVSGDFRDPLHRRNYVAALVATLNAACQRAVNPMPASPQQGEGA